MIFYNYLNLFPRLSLFVSILNWKREGLRIAAQKKEILFVLFYVNAVKFVIIKAHITLSINNLDSTVLMFASMKRKKSPGDNVRE